MGVVGVVVVAIFRGGGVVEICTNTRSVVDTFTFLFLPISTGVLRRLLQSTESRAKLAHTTPIGGTRSEHEWMMRATRPFLKVYLSRSAARIQEALTLMGVATKKSGGSSSNSVGNYNLSVSLPSKKDISTYVECVRHELRFVRHDGKTKYQQQHPLVYCFIVSLESLIVFYLFFFLFKLN